jgi:hypothetical protein
MLLNGYPQELIEIIIAFVKGKSRKYPILPPMSL